MPLDRRDKLAWNCLRVGLRFATGSAVPGLLAGVYLTLVEQTEQAYAPDIVKSGAAREFDPGDEEFQAVYPSVDEAPDWLYFRREGSPVLDFGENYTESGDRRSSKQIHPVAEGPDWLYLTADGALLLNVSDRVAHEAAGNEVKHLVPDKVKESSGEARARTAHRSPDGPPWLYFREDGLPVVVPFADDEETIEARTGFEEVAALVRSDDGAGDAEVETTPSESAHVRSRTELPHPFEASRRVLSRRRATRNLSAGPDGQSKEN